METPEAMRTFVATHTILVLSFALCACPCTYLIRRIINCFAGFGEFLPNVAAFSQACVSLVEDLYSIRLLNDDMHSLVWLYFWFTIFPIAEAAFAELAECWDVPGRLDDLLFAIFFECFQATLFLYFADFSTEAYGIFGVLALYQVVMATIKTYTKTPTIIKGGVCGFIKKYKIALGTMLAFAMGQFILDVHKISLPTWLQLAFAVIPWSVGLTMDLDEIRTGGIGNRYIRRMTTFGTEDREIIRRKMAFDLI